MSGQYEDRGRVAAALDPGVMLRMWRERALLTQEQLAEQTGLNVRTIRRFERDHGLRRPQSASIRVLAERLGLTKAERADLIVAFAAAHSRTTDKQTIADHPVVEAASLSSHAVPRQLPAAPSRFIGRAHEIADIEGMINPGMVSIIRVDGMPGIGKTALVMIVAHRRAGDYPDGQIYIDLHGYTRGVRPVEPAEALDRVLRSLGVPGDQVPPGVDERAALYRSRLADRRVLILLDNARSEAHFAPLVPGAPGCLLLVTTRRRLATLDETSSLSLDLLPLSDAVDLLAGAAGVLPVNDELREHLAEAADLCERLPLALRIAAARLRSHPSWTVGHLVERLRGHEHPLNELEAGERSVRAALDLSHAELSAEEQQAYELLGFHPGGDIDMEAAAALIGIPLPHARQILDNLLDAHLLQESVPGRYHFHDLVRSHATTSSMHTGIPADRSAPLHRLLDHYCRAATAAAGHAYPYEKVDLKFSAGDAVDPRDAAAWLDAEMANLIAAARFAAEHGAPDRAVTMSAALRRHLWVRGRYTDAAVLHELARASAQSVGDRVGELAALSALGRVRRLEGRHVVAAELFAAAATLARSLRDPEGEADALNGTAMVHLLQSRFRAAADDFGEALRVARRAGRRNKELEALFGLGCVQLAQGRAAPAVFEQALEIARSTGHLSGCVRALAGLGHCQRILRLYELANESLTAALRLARGIGERFGELDALIGLGMLQLKTGSYGPAMAHYREALELAPRIGARRYRFEALHGVGLVYQARGESRDALPYHQQALELATELGQAAAQVRAGYALATAAHHSLGRDGTGDGG